MQGKSGQVSGTKLTRRGFLKGVAAAGAFPVAGGLLGACGGGGDSGSAAGGGGDTLEFWAFAPERTDFVKKLVASDAWKSAHPGLKVNFRIYEYEQMHDKLLSALVAGQGAPDIADVEISRFGAFLKGDRIPFEPLSDRIGDEINNLYKAAATDPWSWEGEIYGIGNELNTCTFVYRKDVMNDAGIRTPFETWDEVIAAGKRISKGDAKMFAIHDISFGDWYMLSQSAGATLFDEQGNYSADDPKSVEAMQFNHDLVYEHNIAGIAPAVASDDWYPPQYWAAFKAERFLATWGPPWHLGGLKQNVPNLAGKWTVQPFPAGLGDGRPTANFGGTGQCITEQSANADLAWELIKAANLTTEGVLGDFQLRAIYPSYQPAYEAKALQGPYPYFSNVKIGDIYAQIAPELPSFNQSPVWPDATEGLIRAVVTPVMQDKADAQTALTEFRTEVEKMIQRAS